MTKLTANSPMLLYSAHRQGYDVPASLATTFKEVPLEGVASIARLFDFDHLR